MRREYANITAIGTRRYGRSALAVSPVPALQTTSLRVIEPYPSLSPLNLAHGANDGAILKASESSAVTDEAMFY
jgi:hypothetical protein